MKWLLEQSVFERLQRQRDSARATAADRLRFMELSGHAPGQRSASALLPYCARVAGGTMEIDVKGVLTREPDFWAWLLYGDNTAYVDIQSALSVALSDATISKVIMAVHSPGGQVDGLFELLGDIQAFTKPIETRTGLAASAAYAISAATRKITALSPAVEVGSVGIVQSYTRWTEVQYIDVTNTESPDKRPDPATEEGKAVIREELDALFDIFVGVIAEGRGVTKDDVTSEFGRGRVFVAGEAKKRGMIDTVVQLPKRAETKAAAGGESKKHMTKDELKAQHPEVYAAVLKEGHASGVTEGTTAERERVEAHLTMGESNPASMQIAVDAIKGGTAFGHAPTQAKYSKAAQNGAAIATRQEESDATAAKLGAVPTATPAASTQLDQVVAQMGLK